MEPTADSGRRTDCPLRQTFPIVVQSLYISLSGSIISLHWALSFLFVTWKWYHLYFSKILKYFFQNIRSLIHIWHPFPVSLIKTGFQLRTHWLKRPLFRRKDAKTQWEVNLGELGQDFPSPSPNTVITTYTGMLWNGEHRVTSEILDLAHSWHWYLETQNIMAPLLG